MLNYLFPIFLLLPSFLFSQSEHEAGAKWNTQYDEAIQESTNSGKHILMVFSGSDWCKPCIQLRENIWESDAFKAYAQNNLVLLELDFPASKKNRLPEEQMKHNEALAEKYNPHGAFPAVVLLDSSGKEITRFEYHKRWMPADYIKLIENHI